MMACYTGKCHAADRSPATRWRHITNQSYVATTSSMVGYALTSCEAAPCLPVYLHNCHQTQRADREDCGQKLLLLLLLTMHRLLVLVKARVM